MAPSSWFVLQLSEYKALSQSLQVSGARLLQESSSPLGLISLLENRKVPLRLAPGLSLNNPDQPPPQLGLFIDGDAPSAFTRYQGERQTLRYLDYQTSALPYHLIKPKRVLILGLGGGSGLLQAEYHQIPHIEAVELDPRIIRLFSESLAEFTGWEFIKQHTEIHEAEARSFIAGSEQRYDLIQVSLMDSAGAGTAGLQGLNESYLYTRESLSSLIQRLQPGGLLSITRWLRLPPRDGLKLLATALQALRGNGIAQPERQLLMIRGWNTTTLLIKKEPFTRTEIDAMVVFCEQRSFDRVYHVGIQSTEINRYNLLAEPYFHQGALALLGESWESFIEEYKFDIQPATDDRPFFFNFFRWSSLPEILSLHRRGGFSLLELGYPVLILTLLQALAASLLLILLPVWYFKRKGAPVSTALEWSVSGYFLAIGLAYLFIEIAFLQKFILFLAHPIYAISVVLCGFLIFSGLGSRYSRQLLQGKLPLSLFRIMLLLSAITLIYLWAMPLLFTWLAKLPLVGKAMVSLALIAPIAFCMGMPFPHGLSKLAGSASQLIPWAWGINGCASLLSTILATLLAIHLGFNMVIMTALLLYLLAGLIERGLSRT
jgi:hypothetical protein